MKRLAIATLVTFGVAWVYGMTTAVLPAIFTSPERRIPVSASPGVVLAVDVTGDGIADIAVASQQNDNVSILIGDGNGGFTPASGSPFPAGHAPNDIAAADFNGDGKTDLAFANHEERYLTILLGNGRGVFAAAPGSPFPVDVRPHTHGIATGDFDGNGCPDLVTDSWGTDQMLVLFGDGKGGFSKLGRFYSVGRHPYQRPRVADVNGDGRDDLVTGNLDGDDVTVLLGDGKGGLAPAPGSPFACGVAPFNIAVGDVNGDGKPDIAVVNSPTSTSDRHGVDGVTILFGNGRGGFVGLAGSPFQVGRMPNLVAIGDVNADGIADVVVSSPDDNRVTVLLMSRSHGVASRVVIPISGGPKGVAICDLNRDGRGDIVVGCATANAVSILMGPINP